MTTFSGPVRLACVMNSAFALWAEGEATLTRGPAGWSGTVVPAGEDDRVTLMAFPPAELFLDDDTHVEMDFSEPDASGVFEVWQTDPGRQVTAPCPRCATAMRRAGAYGLDSDDCRTMFECGPCGTRFYRFHSDAPRETDSDL